VSRSSGIIEDFQTRAEGHGAAWAKLLGHAERGDEVETRALAVQLAHQVLASPVIQLAHEVLAGGPHATAKAIELAEALSHGEATALPLPVAAGGKRKQLP